MMENAAPWSPPTSGTEMWKMPVLFVKGSLGPTSKASEAFGEVPDWQTVARVRSVYHRGIGADQAILTWST